MLAKMSVSVIVSVSEATSLLLHSSSLSLCQTEVVTLIFPYYANADSPALSGSL